MKPKVVGPLLGCMVALAGCAQLWPKRPPPVVQDPESHYHRLELTGLVTYGGRAAAMDDAALRAECDHLQQLAVTNPSLGLRLHVAALQGVGDVCGSVEEALEGLRQVKAELKDDTLLAWAAYQEHLLGRLAREADLRRETELRAKQATEKSLRSQRDARIRESQLKTLQDKLDALKSIEQDQDLANPQKEP